MGPVSYVVKLALAQRGRDQRRGRRYAGRCKTSDCVPSYDVPDCDRSLAGLNDELDDAPPVGREFTLLRLIRKRSA